MAEKGRRTPILELVRKPAVDRPPSLDSDPAIVGALRAGDSAGGVALYDRYGGYVRRVLMRMLGPDAELTDLTQDVFMTAIDSIERLEDPAALRAWLAGIGVHLARAEIRRKVRSRRILSFPPGDLPAVAATMCGPEVDAALRATYRVLEKLAPDERILFALRFIEGMNLVEVAGACDVSLATAKRRLARARKKFVTIARTVPELCEWLEEEPS
jgi:RNA polymerase sigma-70 factor (ECF subfamily)